MNDLAGDGTTTVAVLAQVIVMRASEMYLRVQTQSQLKEESIRVWN